MCSCHKVSLVHPLLPLNMTRTFSYALSGCLPVTFLRLWVAGSYFRKSSLSEPGSQRGQCMSLCALVFFISFLKASVKACLKHKQSLQECLPHWSLSHSEQNKWIQKHIGATCETAGQGLTLQLEKEKENWSQEKRCWSPFYADWTVKLKEHIVSCHGSNGPEEILSHVGLLQRVTLIHLKRGGHFCWWINMDLMQQWLQEVLILKQSNRE